MCLDELIDGGGVRYQTLWWGVELQGGSEADCVAPVIGTVAVVPPADMAMVWAMLRAKARA